MPDTATLTGPTAQDFRSDQEIRWCPGCGDYAILAAMQTLLPQLGIPRERIVFISGIGCSSRFPYYLNTYGMHSIHGRAPTIATGLSVARPDLSIWVITGDGDALSIGGNHLIHALRRNINVKILMFNNRVYGLTKGQYSPTSPPGTISKSTPAGSPDAPLNPLSLAIGAEATFVARSIDTDRHHLLSVLEAAAQHDGSAFVEIYQNCHIFNDGAFLALKQPATREDHTIRLSHGDPLTFGPDGRHCVVRSPEGLGLRIAPAADTPARQILRHDATIEDPTYAFALTRLAGANHRNTPIGVFRNVSRPSYNTAAGLPAARTNPSTEQRHAVLEVLLNTPDTWTVS